MERLNHTIQDEFYSAAFRQKLYRTVEEVQEDQTAPCAGSGITSLATDITVFPFAGS